MKYCVTCDKFLEENDFYANRSSRKCKNCIRELCRLNHRRKLNGDGSSIRTCGKCREKKNIPFNKQNCNDCRTTINNMLDLKESQSQYYKYVIPRWRQTIINIDGETIVIKYITRSDISKLYRNGYSFMFKSGWWNEKEKVKDD